MPAPQKQAKTGAAGRADAQHYAAQQCRFQPDAAALRAELQRQRSIAADLADGASVAGPDYWEGFRREMSELLDVLTPSMGASPDADLLRDHLRAEGWRMDADGTFQDYTGTTDMHWDGSTENNTLLNEDDETHRLTCGLHEWDSPVTGGFEREEEPAQ